MEHPFTWHIETHNPYPRDPQIEAALTRDRLLAAMQAQGVTVKDAAAIIGVHPRTFRRRLSGESQFTWGDMTRLVEALHLDKAEALRVFFPSAYEEQQLLATFERSLATACECAARLQAEHGDASAANILHSLHTLTAPAAEAAAAV